MKKINLELDEKQYQTLVEAVFLGTWMVNSTKLELDEDFEEIRELVLSKYKEAGLEDKISYQEAFEVHDLQVDYERQLFEKYVDEYEEFSFWDMLIEKLSEKRLKEEYGDISVPLSDEMMERRLQIEEELGNELEERGITNLELK
ncbi:hypothetical protein GCM10010954_13860 [Halobacillus andaensis]|uniref:Uncharacterized protein n=1 Tax=Halobacillus andaensis TaxID=1176239 RepID=A0A917B261_HALAA|nr:hypothetical protein [Halobacillus andaensis]MBP2004188.1 hypothetical protein [Halobacillus andaensis]GGF16477.1 hypothetical protein GCM10010954_13860 [Halobacillus andaensis]